MGLDIKDLSTLLESFTRKGPAGCACGIAKDGKTLYEGYFGLADIQTGKPIDENTIYRLFSMTKVIVCTAALMLFERGKFLLDDPIYEYFPEYRQMNKVLIEPNGRIQVVPATGPILVRHAFTMGVGIPYPMDSYYSAQEVRNVRGELTKIYGKYNLRMDIKAMSRVPMEFEPGTHWLYGFGHELVAGMVEAASGMTVGEFLRKEIFEPLGMDSTGYRYYDDLESRMATTYQRGEDGAMTPIHGMLDMFHQPDAIYEGGGAGLFSSVRDYLRFTQMLANGGELDGVRLIGRKTIDLMRRNHLNQDQMKDFINLFPYLRGYGYGLGVRTMVDPAMGGSNGSLGEFGWLGGPGSWTSIDPDERLSMVYMQQIMPHLDDYYHHRVRALAYGCL